MTRADAIDPAVLLNFLAQVKQGDFTARLPLDWTGLSGKVADAFNEIIAVNQVFCEELARVSELVGKQGKLSRRIERGGLTSSWSGPVESVNNLIDDLVRPTSEMQRVIGAVADGDLSKKISIDVQGEFLELKNTVNAMVDQLNSFAGEVTRVAREVGVEGKLGGQAQSTEVSGVWKDLTDNVNQLAANLTNQVRAISDVATAVTEGDLTRQVRVEASGEVAVLKDALNEMIRTLGETTRENIEQDWLKTNRERFTRMLQGQRDLAEVSAMILSELAPLVCAQHGVFYSMTNPTDGTEPVLELIAGYGYEERKHLSTTFRVGEGLVGQCAKEKSPILLTDVPGDYVRINSGLGSSPPLNIIVLPVLFEGAVRAVVELASFSPFSVTHQAFLEQLPESVGLTMNTIEANTLTENLLRQSQSQAEELAVASKYKSEFIANMSHELRTPLNSLLILAEQLADDPDDDMTDTQVEYADVILASGRDLLGLLNSVLDLAKVESGTASIALADLSIAQLDNDLVREFDHVARSKSLVFTVDVAPTSPPQIVTDPQRLRQVLKNLIANAFKFTERGSVHLQISSPESGWSRETETLTAAPAVIAFAVHDTGIGIEEAQQRRIFEAFAQGDGTTARLYGGTGLGLSISRELVGLLGGEITLASTPGSGSTFTVFLPLGQVATTTTRDDNPPPARERPLSLVAANNWAANDLRAPRPRRNRHNRLDDRPFAGHKILVIDDDYRNVFALTALLERGHADVKVAESGVAALAILEQSPDIDLVLTDIMMPGMDGYDTMRAIRALDQFKVLPIIAVTGKIVPGERDRCIRAGANDYVPKPVDTEALIAAIGPWLPATPASEQTSTHPSAQ